MGLMTALSSAVSGLRTTQAGMDVVASNVANAGSVGYTRRTTSPTENVAGGRPSGVRTGEIQRVLDLTAQKQLRLETAGAAYTSLTAQFAGALDRLFGPPGGASSLDGTLNGFTSSLSRLASNPGDYSARTAVLDQAGVLASRISSIAEGVQSLRTEAEGRIGSAVTRANELLKGIEETSAKIVKFGQTPSLLDERDRMVTELSSLMDVRTMEGQNGSFSLMTTAGTTLFNGVRSVTLEFDARGILGPQNLYAPPPATSGVGTITAVNASGQRTDLVAQGAIRSGEIAAALELRDETLVQAQRQLDELASGIALALSETRGQAAANGAGDQGFTVDLTGAQAGDVIRFDYVDASGQARRASILVRNGALPSYPTPATTDPNEPVFELNLSPSLAAGAAALGGSLGGAFQVDAPGPATLRILQNAARTTQVTGLSAAKQGTGLTGGLPVALFVDGKPPQPYTGITASGSQLAGFAQRMAVNPDLHADRSKLVVYAPGVPSGDSARPQFLLDALTKASRSFSASSGVGGQAAPYTSSVADFARRVVEDRGSASEMAQRLDEGQKVALASIESRFAESSGVNIDQEMAQLVQLQTAYGANARVMTAVKEMMDLLLRI